QYRQTERLRLPTCAACSAAAKRVRPLSVTSGLDCRLLVHRHFRQHFEALNGRKKLDWEADTETDPHAKPELRILGGLLKLW
ncbi:MAG TPA: hypothetical protein PLW86_04580, partial [Rhodocyclaceae bacterium]|nr:hypothetical protein [Rhodocyclaceae bacterium]